MLYFRSESADPAGNVQGSYAYTNAEGNSITVRYTAGAETGFVIENQEELNGKFNRSYKKVIN